MTEMRKAIKSQRIHLLHTDYEKVAYIRPIQAEDDAELVAGCYGTFT
jgi:hypothetical protein